MAEINTTIETKLHLQKADGDQLNVVLRGAWKSGTTLPSITEVAQAIQSDKPARLTFETTEVTAWDSGLLVFLQKCAELSKKHALEFDDSGILNGPRKLLQLAMAVPEQEGANHTPIERSLFYKVGSRSIRMADALMEVFTFIGEAMIALGRFCIGKARFRWSDLMMIIQQCGAEALPIVALISFLVGLILAFVGAVQLLQFGASIYVANLVGLAMVREMGAMMAGIIMCGRTGAAFAAQLGTMKVNEEIDALKSMGLSPMEFLVLPRMIALFLMMPLLVLFADFVGIIGGLVVSLSMLDVTFNQYINQTVEAVDLTNFSTGIIKSVFFGFIVAGSGCLRGMQCGNSSAAVGVAATSAVVTGITLLILADALFAVIFNILGI